MSLISDIQKNLAKELAETDSIIFDRIRTKEELINLIAGYLFEAGGKRIRPMLTILSCKLFGGDPADSVKLGAAIEFIHNATLLHDDVVDESPTRRSRPTAHTIWGNKACILVGDFLFGKAFGLMVEVGLPRALFSLSNASTIISQGEVAQLARLRSKLFLNEKEYMEIIDAKTAALFASSCEVGAVTAGAQKDLSDILFRFGDMLGKIFQISDDLLDYEGNSENMGKNIGKDFLEGKITLPLIFLRNKLPEKDRLDLETLLKSDERTFSNFEYVQKLFLEFKIGEEVKNYLNELQKPARAALAELKIENIYKDYLSDLLSFAVNRTY